MLCIRLPCTSPSYPALPLCLAPATLPSPAAGSVFFPSPEELVRDCGKMALLDRLLNRLLPGGHKVLIFSQVQCDWEDRVGRRGGCTGRGWWVGGMQCRLLGSAHCCLATPPTYITCHATPALLLPADDLPATLLDLKALALALPFPPVTHVCPSLPPADDLPA